jgi:DNA topoisomerase-2
MKVTTYLRDETAEDTMSLAFGKNNAGERNVWLVAATADPPQEPEGTLRPLSTFVNQELINYGLAANRRAIPSIWDGLKPSQRKVLFTLLNAREEGFKTEIKVAQLAARVSLDTGYHHGEK